LGSRKKPATQCLVGVDLSEAMIDQARQRGMLGFTVEQGDVSPFIFTDSGRFTHHQNHLLAVVDAAGYRVVTQAEEVLRFEYGEAVHGWVTVVQRPSGKSVV
jgi:predicted TPR repeat methyltransferase